MDGAALIDHDANALRRAYLCALVALEREVPLARVERAATRCLRLARRAAELGCDDVELSYRRAAHLLFEDHALLAEVAGNG